MYNTYLVQFLDGLSCFFTHPPLPVQFILFDSYLSYEGQGVSRRTDFQLVFYLSTSWIPLTWRDLQGGTLQDISAQCVTRYWREKNLVFSWRRTPSV